MPPYRTIPRTCEVCGADFMGRASIVKLGKARYCGDACRNVGRSRPKPTTKKLPRTCERCGKVILKAPSAIAAGRGRFCGRICKDAAQENKVTLMCETCGASFSRKASLAGKYPRSFCSAWCEHNRHPQTITVSDDGATARIPLFARDGTIKDHAVIDAADVAWASQYRWYMTAGGYVVRSPGIRLHRDLLELGPSDDDFGDHINLNKLDNRRSNLRSATPSESPQNVPGRPGSSQHRGVAWSGGNRPWQAYCNVGGIRVYSEFFATEDEAAEAARQARAQFLPFATN
jgi:hypothetical protein